MELIYIKFYKAIVVLLRNKIIVFLFLLKMSLLTSAQALEPIDDYEKALKSYHDDNYNNAHIHLKNVMRQNPSHLPSKLLLGQVLLQKKEVNAAIQILTEALQMGADKNLVYIFLAKAYLQQRNYLAVFSLAIEELNLDNQYQLLMIQGNAWLRQNNDLKALEKFNQALQIKPNGEGILKAIGSFYIHQGHLDKANYYINKINNLNPISSSGLYLRAQVFIKNKQHKEALSLLEKAYQLSPSDRLIGRTLAQTYITLNQIVEARSIIEILLIETSDDPFLMLLNARLHSMNKENELATIAYDKIAMQLSNIPSEVLVDLPELLYVSGLANYMLDNYVLAEGHIKRYLAEEVGKLYPVTILADIYMKQDRPSDAVILMEKYYDLVTQDLVTSVRLCNQYLINKKPHKCDALIDELANIHGSHIALTLLKVKVMQAQNRYTEALHFFEEKMSLEIMTLGHKRLKAILYSQNKQHQEALEILNDLLTASPKNINYMQLMINELLALKQYPQAKKINDQVLTLLPENFRAKYIDVELLYLNEDYYQAQKSAEKLTVIEPSSFLATLLLSNTLIAQNKLDEALEASIKAKGKSKGASVKPSENIIRIYRLQGEQEKALAELETLNKKFFLAPKYVLEKAELNLLMKNYDAARLNYNILFSIWSDSHQKLLLLGQKQRLAGFYQDAENSFLRGLSLSPDFILLKIELLRLLLIQQKIEQAEKIIAPLMKKHANNANIVLLAGDIALNKEQPEKALQYFLLALKLNNNYHQAIYRLKKIIADYQLGHNEFEQVLTNIVEKYPDETTFHRHTLADYLLEQGNEQAAKQHYLQIIKKVAYPNLKYAFNNLANIFITTDPKLALKYIDEAIKQDSTIADFFFIFGWILVNSEQLNQGLTYLRDAYTLNSENPINWFHLGYTLHKLNRNQEASREFNKVIAIKKDFPEKKQAMKLLDSF